MRFQALHKQFHRLESLISHDPGRWLTQYYSNEAQSSLLFIERGAYSVRNYFGGHVLNIETFATRRKSH